MVAVARKPLRALGVDYAPGDPVPLDDLPLRTRQQLIDQRKVIFEDEDSLRPDDIETKPRRRLRLTRKG